MLNENLKDQFVDLIYSEPALIQTAQACVDVGLPNFYIGGGVLTELIWNHQLDLPLLSQIKDIDIIYFDSDGEVSQQEYQDQISGLVTHGYELDVKNQARIHDMYLCKFGMTVQPYLRVEQGIESWLPAFAIGFTLNHLGEVECYAPYGLSDAFNLVVRPNKTAMTQASYEKMVASYQTRWPQVSVLPWN